MWAGPTFFSQQNQVDDKLVQHACYFHFRQSNASDFQNTKYGVGLEIISKNSGINSSSNRQIGSQPRAANIAFASHVDFFIPLKSRAPGQ